MEGQTIRLILDNEKIFETLLDAFKVDTTEADIEEIKIVSSDGEELTNQHESLAYALEEFWQQFYTKCTAGAVSKVPRYCIGFNENEWLAVGKIIAFGWRTQKYFPVKLAKSFVAKSIGADITKIDVLLDFMFYVNESERNILDRAIINFDSVETSCVIDVVSNYGCRWSPKRDNIVTVVTDIAYTNLIYNTDFVSKLFGMCLRNVVFKADILTIYSVVESAAEPILNTIAFAANSYKEEILDMKADDKFVVSIF